MENLCITAPMHFFGFFLGGIVVEEKIKDTQNTEGIYLD